MRAQVLVRPATKTGGRLRRLVLGGALAALLAMGALGAGAGVGGDPSQWGVTAGDPSQWGLAGPTSLNDPPPMSLTPPNGNPKTALNFTKVEYKNIPMSGLNFAKIEF
jgi:hypothetical protein